MLYIHLKDEHGGKNAGLKKKKKCSLKCMLRDIAHLSTGKLYFYLSNSNVSSQLSQCITKSFFKC